ncbi:MAG: hypothetical protein ABW184_09005 [Sphingobium sp.]
MLTDQFLCSLEAADKPISESDGGGLHICVVPHGTGEGGRRGPEGSEYGEAFMAARDASI